MSDSAAQSVPQALPTLQRKASQSITVRVEHPTSIRSPYGSLSAVDLSYSDDANDRGLGLKLDTQLDDEPAHFSSLPASPLDAPPGPLFPTVPIAPTLSRSHSTLHKNLHPGHVSSAPPTSSLVTHAVDALSSGRRDSRRNLRNVATPFTLWEYLQEELLATDFDSHQEMKWERVSNFLNVPVAVEKIILFGFILCFDSFLYTFTILPIRSFIAFGRLGLNAVPRSLLGIAKSTKRPPPLPAAQKADLLRALLLIVSIGILAPLTNVSKIYHSIRGQDTIKLYVIFNALEIADRLFASFGQDILDCLFSRSNLMLLSHHVPVSARTLRPISFFVLATLYTVGHSLVLVYQLTALNVAINSYDHSLLTLLVSNQFVEIKGSVFKKFEKDSLFQITCADIVERFQLALMLVSIAFRNLIEVTGSTFDFAQGSILPKSFNWVQGRSIAWTVLSPVMSVMLSEVVVDWLKHAFITKFNHIRPSVYERYTDVLCRDLASGSAVGRRRAVKHTYVDQSPLVARRLGFSALPTAVLSVLLGAQSVHLLFINVSADAQADGKTHVLQWLGDDILRQMQWAILGVLFWLCLVLLKILLGLQLIGHAASRLADADRREAEDVVNDFGRDPIGEGDEERAYNKELKTLLNQARDDMIPTAEMGETGRSDGAHPIPPAKEKDGDGASKKRLKLEELTRFTMVKRIW
ncbi:eukaryotic membrane protein family-domain-containing protein [Auriculariales sp. MPI-PUGE-AT-0066]|nr:eukaryotic membrane protein family-domain-containing protein [Auriculariales sp. MPI-PUGE-AT-0066]